MANEDVELYADILGFRGLDVEIMLAIFSRLLYNIINETRFHLMKLCV